MTYGAYRALALLKIVPDDKVIKDIVSRGSDIKATEFLAGYPGDQTGLRLWVAEASAGWKDELKANFLKDCDSI